MSQGTFDVVVVGGGIIGMATAMALLRRAPRRLVVLEFPSKQAAETFYHGPVYQGLKAIRNECSSANLVLVEGV